MPTTPVDDDRPTVTGWEVGRDWSGQLADLTFGHEHAAGAGDDRQLGGGGAHDAAPVAEMTRDEFESAGRERGRALIDDLADTGEQTLTGGRLRRVREVHDHPKRLAVIDQLHSIGSSLQVSTKEGKIMSLGDGLARARANR